MTFLELEHPGVIGLCINLLFSISKCHPKKSHLALFYWKESNITGLVSIMLPFVGTSSQLPLPRKSKMHVMSFRHFILYPVHLVQIKIVHGRLSNICWIFNVALTLKASPFSKEMTCWNGVMFEKQMLLHSGVLKCHSFPGSMPH